MINCYVEGFLDVSDPQSQIRMANMTKYDLDRTVKNIDACRNTKQRKDFRGAEMSVWRNIK